MEIILVSRRSSGNGTFRLGWWVLCGLGFLVIAALGAAGYAGLRYAEKANDFRPDLSRAMVEEAVRQQSLVVDEAIEQAEEHVDALALRLGSLQAQMIRLDALGSRLVDMANLDTEEFDFGQEPALGGSPPDGVLAVSVPDFVAELEVLSQQIEDRSEKLAVLEQLLLNEHLQASVHPDGTPVEVGWISSGFGYRSDPLTGKKSFHAGLDFAGPAGSRVVAVAAGVVVSARYKTAFGNTVEINHGNGYSTVYAHNREILVKVGEMVKKGQPIALLGSSGRSTGPHVHFEVLLNGQPVNPAKYVEADY